MFDSMNSYAWIDRYAPEEIKDVFLPKAARNQLETYLDKKNFPNLLFSGPPGIGKTTTAFVLCKQLDFDFISVNASLSGIDLVRNDIISFCSSLSINGNRKVVILDEGDGLTSAAQSALRGVINEFSERVSFILTANFENRLIEPLISRFNKIDFTFPKTELNHLGICVYRVLVRCLEDNHLKYDDSALKKFVASNIKKTNDIRNIINKCQSIADSFGEFSLEGIKTFEGDYFSDLINLLKNKDFNKICEWVYQNPDIDNALLVSMLFKNRVQIFKNELLFAKMVIILNQYQYNNGFVADKVLNNIAMLFEISELC